MDAELYSTRDVARIFDLGESRVQYWARTGVAGPSVRKGTRAYYCFSDLITVKAAKELLERGISLQAVRKNLHALRAALPEVDRPLARLRVLSDGDRLVVHSDDRPFEPLTGQLVMEFGVAALQSQVAQVMALPAPVGLPTVDSERLSEESSAWTWFKRGCALDQDLDQAAQAAEAYRRALALDPRLAASYTNLGNLEHRLGRRGEARALYEKALELDPEQPEARYNLANLLDELGEGAQAIYEWTRVVAWTPDFADAHFNLGAALAREGDGDGARLHLRRYLALEREGLWAAQAQSILAGL